jgi:hypothetical protein
MIPINALEVCALQRPILLGRRRGGYILSNSYDAPIKGSWKTENQYRYIISSLPYPILLYEVKLIRQEAGMGVLVAPLKESFDVFIQLSYLSSGRDLESSSRR